ncbi:MAG: hypothetical protein QOH69_996 [Actinomycetota bacterium]|nr:hypothetical protein [Actinomycetota bacterium]
MIPPPATLLSGKEKFVGPGGTVNDFWRFALGDLRMNNARGYLAEYLVATALGIEDVRRIEWDAYDVLWNGITIEVKSSAYLQSWDQRRLSTITFAGLKGTRLHPRHGYDPAGPRYNAMVYVFCVQAATAHDVYDQLDVGQWEFYVLPRSDLEALGYKSIGLPTVQSRAGEKRSATQLRDSVELAARNQERSEDNAKWWTEE